MRMADGNTAALERYESSEIVISEYDRKIARDDVKDRMIYSETEKTFDAFLDNGGLGDWLESADRRWLFAAISKSDRMEIGTAVLNALERYVDAHLDGRGIDLVDAEAIEQAYERTSGLS